MSYHIYGRLNIINMSTFFREHGELTLKLIEQTEGIKAKTHLEIGWATRYQDLLYTYRN